MKLLFKVADKESKMKKEVIEEIIKDVKTLYDFKELIIKRYHSTRYTFELNSKIERLYIESRGKKINIQGKLKGMFIRWDLVE